MVTFRATPRSPWNFHGRHRNSEPTNSKWASWFGVLVGLSFLHRYHQTVVDVSPNRRTEAQDATLPLPPKAATTEPIDHFRDPAVSQQRWMDAMKRAEELLDTDPWNAECLVPNTAQTEELLRKLEAQPPQPATTNTTAPKVPLPVLNAGMPKLGSTTLYKYFTCKGLPATHWQQGTDHFEGICMRDAVRVGLPPLQTCAPNIRALTQMDVAFPMGVRNEAVTVHLMRPAFASEPLRDDCFFPQLSLLEAFDRESPDATFVLAFRPLQDWIRSILGWASMMERLSLCHLPNLPRGIPDLAKPESLNRTMAQFFCSHVVHLRRFVEDHPGHALLELDLYDPATPDLLDRFFPSVANNSTTTKGDSCWAVSNQGKHSPTNGWDQKHKQLSETKAARNRKQMTGGRKRRKGTPR